MKENEKESKDSKVFMYILIAIIVFVVVGIRVYTRYLDKQNQEAVERIMQRNIEDHGTPF